MHGAVNRIRSEPGGVLVYAGLSILVLVLYSSWNRPLWYDEMVYFVLGGMDSTGDVLSVIRETTTNVNQGVTGAYMLAEYWSLSAFGAQLWAVRLPSLLFGTYFLVVSAVFLRGRRVPWIAVWALPVLLIGQQTLMYYVGEARTYMPLVAATAGILTYYFVPMESRRTAWPRILGWSAVLIGVSFHPYFALYWPAVLIFAVVVQGKWRNIVAFANPLLVAVGGVLYVAIASATWLRGNAPTEDLDPYFWLGDELWRAVPAQLFQGIYVERVLVVAVGILALVVVAVTCRTRKNMRRTLQVVWPPVALIGVAALAAFAISLISLQQGFWIIPRQWVASIGLASVSMIWLLGVTIERLSEVADRRVAYAATGAAWLIVLASAVSPAGNQALQLQTWFADRQAIVVDDLPNRASFQQWVDQMRNGQVDPWDEDGWIAFSNANVWRGGEVWPEFGEYYRTRDWNEFILRD